MKIRDIAAMALHNLWSRKMRTALNLAGVVISCVMLVMTLAGTRGASEGIQTIIGRSDEVRRFVVHSSYGDNMEVPESELVVEGEMSQERRERIRELKRDDYINAHYQRTLIGPGDLEQLRAIPYVQHIVPEVHLTCEIRIDDVVMQASTNPIRPQDQSIKERLIAGSGIGESNASEMPGVLVSEYTAYQLGFKSDSDLERLIGRTITLEYQVGHERVLWALDLLTRTEGDSDPVRSAELLIAIGKLIKDIDSTDLSAQERELIRETFSEALNEPQTTKSLEPGKFNNDRKDATDVTAENASSDPHKKQASLLHLFPNSTLKVNDRGALVLVASFKIRGVVRNTGNDDFFSFLRVVYRYRDGNVLMDSRLVESIGISRENSQGFWAVTGEVDDVGNLREVVDAMHDAGYECQSAIRIVETVDREIGKIRLAISALALLILLIAAIGISNTMIIAVLERTPEFGIMKSLGARNSHVMLLMIIEGALTGLLGAAAAVLISAGIAWGIGKLVRNYIQSRLGEDYSEQIFVYSPLDLFWVFLIASVVCTIASVLPAWRAARLDPVVAMRHG